ncbi:threonine synthase [Candidatus Lucifugimonas marina]|uniref:Threonine synthase n=1 Tax=Candidatus Lucifugimonas marina TaxID=3038979 RepID=A0ABD4XNW1_9CHLR|nr:threonine synthase [SAR202 cluster bacterium JH702]MDG0868553.1 threonine synthase [SAR202 cluster bacterium JH639]WFG35190.1 threonine synthase [SAR202 cluster bacterium JH545]
MSQRTEIRSHITHLECSLSGEPCGHELPHRLNPKNGKPYLARYDLAAAAETMTKESMAEREPNMWRYREVMPVVDPANIVTLGEGFTPLRQAGRLGKHLGMSDLLIKDEGVNPTGSFKARGLSAAVSKALELKQMKLTMPSAGNAAGAMSAYAAAAGMEAHVYMPKDAPIANQIECVAYGADLNLVDGFITDAGRISGEAAEEHGLFDVSTLKEPYRAEGKKTMGYEIVEQLRFEVPDVVIYPTGGGTGIVGIWKALDEMEQLGWIGSERPRMVCVQAEGCAPLVTAYNKGEEFADPFPNPKTLAAGMRVPAAVGDFLVIRAVRESGGTALTVTDDQMVDSVRDMSSFEGIFPAPEGGATLSALQLLLDSGEIGKDERVVLLNTGSAVKYLDVLGPALGL